MVGRSEDKMANMCHPFYSTCSQNWIKFRDVMRSGKCFVNKYLQQYSKIEETDDFNKRKKITPCPAYAKSAVLEVVNSIYQRMPDVRRQGGPETYQTAIKGESGGVDLTGQSMNAFLGDEAITELLSMARVGIYVDKPTIPEGATKAETNDLKPYLYIYRTEDIINWQYDKNNQLVKVLLRDHKTGCNKYDMPGTEYIQYRLLELVQKDDRLQVKLTILNTDESVEDEVYIDIPVIPLVIAEISESLLTDIADYQIALLNMESGDVNFSIRSNFPFYVEQYQPNAQDYLRPAAEEATADTAKEARQQKAKVGTSQGRQYAKGLDKPDFIHPSPEPLEASMKKQDQMKESIRQLVHLSVNRLKPIRASADSKAEDDQGLVAGLSAVGQELETAERQIAIIWSAYERAAMDGLFVTYPTNYTLRSDAERQSEAEKKLENLGSIPSKTFQRELVKDAARLLLNQRLSEDTLSTIDKEIEGADVIAVNDEEIINDVEAGLVDRETASKARLYPEGSVEKAKKEHLERIKAIALAQTAGTGAELNAARGVDDMEVEGDSAKQEKQDD